MPWFLKAVLPLVCLATLTSLVPVRSAGAEEPFDYFRNSYSVIGLKDYARGARVTPDNRLLLDKKETVQIRFGRQLTPLGRKHTKTLLDGWMPIVLIAADDGPIRYEFTLWATPLTTVKDWKKAFDWPTAGENFAVWITAKVTNTGQQKVEARMSAARQTAQGLGDRAEISAPLQPGETRNFAFCGSFSAGGPYPQGPNTAATRRTSLLPGQRPRLGIQRPGHGSVGRRGRVRDPLRRRPDAGRSTCDRPHGRRMGRAAGGR